MKRIEGNAWNEEHAAIEVKAGINQTYIAEHFRQAAEALGGNDNSHTIRHPRRSGLQNTIRYHF